MQAQASALMVQFLDWVAGDDRTYADAMDAWRTSCPRLSIWEDALADGLIEVAAGTSRRDARVRITPRGERLLVENRHPS